MQGLDHVNIIYAGSVAGICKYVSRVFHPTVPIPLPLR
jgi:hypothetical protein